LSVRIAVLGSGSGGNCTLVATQKTRLLIDAGFSKRETYARLEAIGERTDDFDAIVVSHEHTDHISGLRALALDLNVPVYISPGTRDALRWDPRLRTFELFSAGERFSIGDIEITPFSIPHDAADPVAFTLEAEGIRIGLVTDLGCIPELVKRHVRGCHCLVFESNHDLEMLKIGPYPWYVKQRVMSRHGHLSNRTVGEFLSDDFDGTAQVLVLAHLSQTNNHPEVARLSAEEALDRRPRRAPLQLHLASQFTPTPVFRF
jgi:phosphoribosyl 1,2-cyclic phosphodiesterase